MESTIIQASNQKGKGVPFQKEGGKQVRIPSSFYQQASSQPITPLREEEQEKKLEEIIFPKLQDFKNPKRCHGQCLQHGQNLDGIQGQTRTMNETTSFPKETNLSPDVLNTLTEMKNSILPLQDIIENAFKNSFFDPDKDKPLTWLLKQVERLNAPYPEMSQKMVHIKIINKCGGELEHALKSRCIGPCSKEEYINALEDIVTRPKVGRRWKKLDIKSPNKPFIKKDKPKESFKTNTPKSNEEIKCDKCGVIGHLDNSCLKKAKINEIVETEDHNDKEDESDSEKEN
ncbi:hypothetical protein O181_019169 [Austropuccinia psidii MF-1]|uniref:CCHC-type domain-containing protein n=1 Tax=Austropuccinia psidii MF-1 TaxID=1389203 RepID=A0A9Q3GUG6_9BASI|nr:hypothetical protein [Austropuccinia psidii MF-1]